MVGKPFRVFSFVDSFRHVKQWSFDEQTKSSATVAINLDIAHAVLDQCKAL